MAHSFSITDIEETYSFTSGNSIAIDWTPTAAEIKEDATSSTADSSYDDVVESINIRIHEPADKQAVVDDLREIERILNVANDRRINNVPFVTTMSASIDGVSGTWQTEVRGGRVMPAEGTLREWASVGANVTVEIRRRYYWELNTATALSMTYAGGSGTTAALTNNHDDNWVTVSGVAGSLPAPARIELINDESAMNASHEIFISNNVFNDPDSIDPYLTDGDLDVGTAADSWSSSTHDLVSPRWAWDLTNALLSDTGGQYFRVLVGFSAISHDIYLKAHLYNTVSGTNTVVHEGTTETYSGSTSLNKKAVLDLGSMPFPPGGLTSASSVRLGITVRSTGSGSATIDYVMLVPASNFRVLDKPSHSWTSSGSIIDNGIRNIAYAGADSSQYVSIIPRYSRIFIWPNRTNRLTFMYRSGTTFPSGNDFSVKLSVKPRKLTL